MSAGTRKGPPLPPVKPEAKPTDDVPSKSGRATFDERGRTVWEWQVRTGRFDLNADSQRIRALTDIELSLDEPESGDKQLQRQKQEGFSPYSSAAPASRKPPSGGINPYATGPAKRPETVSYNPHRSAVPNRNPPTRQSAGSNPYGDATPASRGLPPRKPGR